MPALFRRRFRGESAGFSLVELMAVVTITGILAALGVVLVRGHVNAAKTNRALVGIQAIRVAEEQFRAQSGQYLSCSSFDTPAWFPMTAPGKVIYDWRPTGAHADKACWARLSIPRTSGTQYGYAVGAGRPGAVFPDDYPTLQTDTDPALPSPAPDLWYVIQVRGDVDGDGTPMKGVATSYNGEVYLEKETE